MKTFGSVFLTWRTGRGYPRSVIGVIKKTTDSDGFSFNYLITKDEANKIGFDKYTAFPDLQKTYTNNVVDIFGMRLTNPERSDIQKYYDFWEIEPQYKHDKLFLLARTQGLRATDNFEFLADYNVTEDLFFISEISGLSYTAVPPALLAEGDELQWQRDPQNVHDKYAVKVFKGNTFLGYVKTIHSKVFHKEGSDPLKIKIKSIDKNGKLNRVFIKIYMPDKKR